MHQPGCKALCASPEGVAVGRITGRGDSRFTEGKRGASPPHRGASTSWQSLTATEAG